MKIKTEIDIIPALQGIMNNLIDAKDIVFDYEKNKVYMAKVKLGHLIEFIKVKEKTK
jgi:hypothetical protein